MIRDPSCNEHEFFSASIESFERSHEFKSMIPELYLIMTRLLNQDPTRDAMASIVVDTYVSYGKSGFKKRAQDL